LESEPLKKKAGKNSLFECNTIFSIPCFVT